jgi:thymidylate synthase (FAD)
MLPVLYAYAAAFAKDGKKQSMKWFMDKCTELDPLIIVDEVIKQETYANWWYKLKRYEELIGGHRKLCELFMSKDAIAKLVMCQTHDECYEALMSSKSKRNAGDAFKYIVDDNWKTELVMTINLRSLKNFLDLRTSGAAWFQIRVLAYKIYDEIPSKYKSLIDKKIYNEKREQEED